MLQKKKQMVAEDKACGMKSNKVRVFLVLKCGFGLPVLGALPASVRFLFLPLAA